VAGLDGAAAEGGTPATNDRGKPTPTRGETIAPVGKVRTAQAAPLRSAGVVSPARAAFVGELRVSSTPPGASVFVNSRTVGSTPLTLKRLPVATYAVRVDLAGFERWSRAIQVSTGHHVRVHATLERTADPTPQHRVP
jgi:hypothetical protein